MLWPDSTFVAVTEIWRPGILAGSAVVNAHWSESAQALMVADRANVLIGPDEDRPGRRDMCSKGEAAPISIDTHSAARQT